MIKKETVDFLILHYNIFALDLEICGLPPFPRLKRSKYFAGFLFILLILFSPLYASAAEWMGIYPLESKRENVEKILGKCESNDSWRCLYQFKEKNVIIYYSDKDCKNGGKWKIPIGTVTDITIHYKKKPTINEVQFNFQEMVQFEDTELPGLIHYSNRKKGLYFTVMNGLIESVYFSAPIDKQKEFSCQ